MRKARQISPLVHDPLGLLALPIESIGRDRPADDGPQPGTNAKLLDAEERLGVANAAQIIGGALVAVLIALCLVAPLGIVKTPQIVSHCHSEGGCGVLSAIARRGAIDRAPSGQARALLRSHCLSQGHPEK